MGILVLVKHPQLGCDHGEEAVCKSWGGSDNIRGGGGSCRGRGGATWTRRGSRRWPNPPWTQTLSSFLTPLLVLALVNKNPKILKLISTNFGKVWNRVNQATFKCFNSVYWTSLVSFVLKNQANMCKLFLSLDIFHSSFLKLLLIWNEKMKQNVSPASNPDLPNQRLFVHHCVLFRQLVQSLLQSGTLQLTHSVRQETHISKPLKYSWRYIQVETWAEHTGIFESNSGRKWSI